MRLENELYPNSWFLVILGFKLKNCFKCPKLNKIQLIKKPIVPNYDLFAKNMRKDNVNHSKKTNKKHHNLFCLVFLILLKF
jgi:hypothetical protein